MRPLRHSSEPSRLRSFQLRSLKKSFQLFPKSSKRIRTRAAGSRNNLMTTKPTPQWSNFRETEQTISLGCFQPRVFLSRKKCWSAVIYFPSCERKKICYRPKKKQMTSQGSDWKTGDGQLPLKCQKSVKFVEKVAYFDQNYLGPIKVTYNITVANEDINAKFGSTGVERTRGRGFNPAGCWAFFSSLSSQWCVLNSGPLRRYSTSDFPIKLCLAVQLEAKHGFSKNYVNPRCFKRGKMFNQRDLKIIVSCSGLIHL